MIPLHDDVPSRTTPYVNYAMIGLCAVAFLFQLQWPDLTERLGMIPARVFDPDRRILIQVYVGIRPQELEPSLVWAWLTPLTCIFLHGGWLHFLGNMWFLWIFGDNVEDCLGHWRYLLFYLAAGVAASLAHLVVENASVLPTVGASGAIAGVMGAYLMLYPRARVLTLIPIFIFIHITVVPAAFFLGFWFLLQFFSGIYSIGGGVAWWAHIGGFVVGFGVVYYLRKRGRLRAAIQIVRQPTERRRIHPFRRRRF